MNPVDTWTTLRLVHRTGRADDQHRHSVYVCVVDRHIGVQQPNEVVQDCHHRLTRRPGIAVRNLYSRFLVLTEQHRRSVATVVHDGVVETAIAGPGVDCRVRKIVRVQQIDDDV